VKLEASIFQGLENKADAVSTTERYSGNDNYWYQRSINYGAGSASFRATVVPVEGLTLIASIKNIYANDDGDASWTWHEGNSAGLAWGFAPTVTGGARNGEAIELANSNTSVFAGFSFNPTFFNRATLWASYMHGWNEGWVKDQDSDSVSFGLNFKVTDQLTAFAAGDWLRVRNDQANTWHRANGWASDIGLNYAWAYGVNLQVGWRHEIMKYENRVGVEHTKFTGDTVYGSLGFSF
jgi:hypothetical protein